MSKAPMDGVSLPDQLSDFTFELWLYSPEEKSGNGKQITWGVFESLGAPGMNVVIAGDASIVLATNPECLSDSELAKVGGASVGLAAHPEWVGIRSAPDVMTTGSASVWQHIALVAKAGAGGSVVLFVDGVEQARFEAPLVCPAAKEARLGVCSENRAKGLIKHLRLASAARYNANFLVQKVPNFHL